MTNLEILQELRAKLSDPAAWHKGSWFSEVDWTHGNYAANHAAAATDCPACLGGWLARITQEEPWLFPAPQTYSQFRAIERLLQHEMEARFFEPDLDVSAPPDLFEWNDWPGTQHKDILLVIDRAILRAQ
jgi:hypothetical protein